MKDKERQYRTSTGSTFTLGSLEDALDSHQRAGLIRGWRPDPRTTANSGTRAIPLYTVVQADREELHLANPWEAFAFLSGLASARHAMELAKRDAERAARKAAQIRKASQSCAVAGELPRPGWC